MVKTVFGLNRKLLWILALAVILRVAAALYLGGDVTVLPGTADQVTYHELAIRLLDGKGFSFGEAWWPVTAAEEPTAHWSYLYTFYLAGVYAVFGINPLAARVIQAVIVGLLHPFLAYWLVSKSIRTDGRDRISSQIREFAPLAAAGITAIYIYFIYYSATLMTESFYITAVFACLALAISLARKVTNSGFYRLAIGLGISISIAVLLRQLYLLVIPFIYLWLATIMYQLQQRWRRIFSTLAITTGILILTILPFTISNYFRFDRFVLLNTNAGYAFFWGNHPIYGTQFRAASEMGTTYQELVPDELRHLDEAALDQELLKLGLEFIVQDPGRYLLLSASRIPHYFKFWPDAASGSLSNLSRVASFGLFLPLMLFGLLQPIIKNGSAKLNLRLKRPTVELLLLYIFITAYTLIHIFSWAQIRYRMPVDAVLVVFAAIGLTAIYSRFKAWQDRELELDTTQRIAQQNSPSSQHLPS